MAVLALSASSIALAAGTAPQAGATATGETPDVFAKLVAKAKPEEGGEQGGEGAAADGTATGKDADVVVEMSGDTGTDADDGSAPADKPSNLLAEMEAMAAAASQIIATPAAVIVPIAPAPAPVTSADAASIEASATTTAKTTATLPIVSASATPTSLPTGTEADKAAPAIAQGAASAAPAIAQPPRTDGSSAAETKTITSDIASLLASLNAAFGAATPKREESPVSPDAEKAAPPAPAIQQAAAVVTDTQILSSLPTARADQAAAPVVVADVAEAENAPTIAATVQTLDSDSETDVDAAPAPSSGRQAAPASTERPAQTASATATAPSSVSSPLPAPAPTTAATVPPPVAEQAVLSTTDTDMSGEAAVTTSSDMPTEAAPRTPPQAQQAQQLAAAASSSPASQQQPNVAPRPVGAEVVQPPRSTATATAADARPAAAGEAADPEAAPTDIAQPAAANPAVPAANPLPATAPRTDDIDGVATAAAPLGQTDQVIDRHLDLARDGQWLDRLARDITQAATQQGHLKFHLNPERLGALTIEIANSAAGAAIRMTTETDQARTIIADAQPQLIAEVRAQGLRVAEARVDVNQDNGGSSNSAQSQSSQSGQTGQQRQSSADHQPFGRTQAVIHDDAGDSAPQDDGNLYA